MNRQFTEGNTFENMLDPISSQELTRYHIMGMGGTVFKVRVSQTLVRLWDSQHLDNPVLDGQHLGKT